MRSERIQEWSGQARW